jgi:5-methylcytosine-specific restriction endonuclease McrA
MDTPDFTTDDLFASWADLAQSWENGDSYVERRPNSTDPNQTHKRCKRCKRLLPLSAFDELDNRVGGLSSRCAECVKDRNRINNQTRRARERNAGGDGITEVDLVALTISQTDKRGRVRCWICGKPMKKGDRSLDHWIPLKRGGAHDPRNCHLVHNRCNHKKQAKHPFDLGRCI